MSIPACRYIGSSSSWYWMPPATWPPISITSSADDSVPGGSAEKTLTGPGSPHQYATAGSAWMACSASASVRSPGRSRTRCPASVGRGTAPVTSAGSGTGPGSVLERTGMSGDVDGMLAQHRQGHDLQGPLMGGGQHDVRRGAIMVGPQPVSRRHAPAVARHEPGKLKLRSRGAEVVADAALMLQEPGGHDRADRVVADVLRPGVAASVAIEAGDRVGAARFQLTTQHVSVVHG